MELVSNTTHTHRAHGPITILKIYREYAVFDSDRDDGSVPGGWDVRYSTGDGDTHIEPVEEFVDGLDTK
ncbi:hypothetical protein OB955_03755 [Halobacteria archaeon AArc-m2/3/4]|uniref:Uncharacterized protein n=1 Tax=Natronoglomus mannanivorans TaxID=2979990 RepID=A0ABT2QAB4_9EURY|nr:hypothetical protein [Halobacteria archaeon AArc-m2/3/4]